MPRRRYHKSLEIETEIEQELSDRRVRNAAKHLPKDLIPGPTECDDRCSEPGSAAYFRHYRRGEAACAEALEQWAILINSYRKKGK